MPQGLHGGAGTDGLHGGAGTDGGRAAGVLSLDASDPTPLAADQPALVLILTRRHDCLEFLFLLVPIGGGNPILDINRRFVVDVLAVNTESNVNFTIGRLTSDDPDAGPKSVSRGLMVEWTRLDRPAARELIFIAEPTLPPIRAHSLGYRRVRSTLRSRHSHGRH